MWTPFFDSFKETRAGHHGFYQPKKIKKKWNFSHSSVFFGSCMSLTMFEAFNHVLVLFVHNGEIWGIAPVHWFIIT